MVFQESETIELKSVVADDIKKEIIAFANCEGGKLYIGVQDDGTVVGLDDPDGTALQISNMIRDAIKPDLTMFLHYQTLSENGKQVVAIDIQQGTERPYYIAKKGLRPEGVYVRQGYSSVPATNTAIRRMIKETDGDHFEEMRSLEQDLTFEAAKQEFSERNILFGRTQMKTLGIMSYDGVYTNLGLLLSDQCVHTIKAAVFEGITQNEFKFVESLMPFTAFDETGIIGFFTLRNPNEAANELRFGFVTIKPDKRGKGYGKAMLRLGLKFVFELYCAKKATLGVFENNPSAYYCYKAVGFHDIVRDIAETETYNVLGEEWKCKEMEIKSNL